jgi:alpha-glucosidase
VTFDGIWLDMNEASSFCEGSWYASRLLRDVCVLTARSGSGANVDLRNTSTPFALPGTPGAMVTDYPEWYAPCAVRCAAC